MVDLQFAAELWGMMPFVAIIATLTLMCIAWSCWEISWCLRHKTEEKSDGE